MPPADCGAVHTRVGVGVAAGPAARVRDTVADLLARSGGDGDPATEVVDLSVRRGPGFAELLQRIDADVYVLMEPGVRVGPRCLELLLAAMQRTGAGLAGPSTN